MDLGARAAAAFEASVRRELPDGMKNLPIGLIVNEIAKA